jgi:hypothetical protein
MNAGDNLQVGLKAEPLPDSDSEINPRVDNTEKAAL